LLNKLRHKIEVINCTKIALDERNKIIYIQYNNISYSTGIHTYSTTFVESLSSTQCNSAASAYGITCYFNVSFQKYSVMSSSMTVELCLQVCSSYGGFTFGALNK